MLKLKLLTAAAVALALGTAASMAVAQQPGDQTVKPETGMMDNYGGGMMGMMKGVDPAQMKRMVDNCNRMMESMMPTAPEKQG
jgi:hypothetical protein